MHRIEEEEFVEYFTKNNALYISVHAIVLLTYQCMNAVNKAFRDDV